MKISKGLKQAYDLQDFAFACALALKNALTKDGKLTVSREDAVAVGRIVDGWAKCQERIRIHRGKPLPGSLRPGKRQVRRESGAIQDSLG